eukprot:CAMPEP_0172609770 /NCGR_PEP_ID=MMETSP1068-20121228/29684_1 /TAXON_ID=35684 /ORGANISM="Pseudopedinella elastica, Strain CCMP716" /LENGTH=56 /DNA_ID=CAMNT_0013413351 /DNA_START=100 /DNA_END=267 /DNA_ORIENTATION=+
MPISALTGIAQVACLRRQAPVAGRRCIPPRKRSAMTNGPSSMSPVAAAVSPQSHTH